MLSDFLCLQQAQLNQQQHDFLAIIVTVFGQFGGRIAHEYQEEPHIQFHHYLPDKRHFFSA